MARHKKNPQNRRLLLLMGVTGFVFLNHTSTLLAQPEGFSSHMAQIEEHISNCKTVGFFSDDLGCAKTFPQLYEFMLPLPEFTDIENNNMKELSEAVCAQDSQLDSWCQLSAKRFCANRQATLDRFRYFPPSFLTGSINLPENSQFSDYFNETRDWVKTMNASFKAFNNHCNTDAT